MVGSADHQTPNYHPWLTFSGRAEAGDHGMGIVKWSFADAVEPLHLFVCQSPTSCSQVVFKMPECAHANDWSSHPWFLQEPVKGDLSWGFLALFCDFK